MEIDFLPHSIYQGASCSPILLNEIENNLFEKHISIYKGEKRIKKLLLKLAFKGNTKHLRLLDKDDE